MDVDELIARKDEIKDSELLTIVADGISFKGWGSFAQ